MKKVQMLCDWEYMLEIGRTHLQETIPPQPSSIYIICHTSGTTGTPKGVQLSHCALLASMAGLYVQWCVPPNAMTFNNDDIHLSFLSLAHVYEQLLELFMIYVGGRVAVFGGDVSKLINDMLFFRPTVVALVPRILSRFHDRILQQMDEQNLLKRLLFRIAFKVKSRMFSRGTLRFDTVWDKFVFKKIHAQLGGKLRLLTTGGAPTSKELIRFSRIVYGCPIFEGYGQTECCAAGTITLPFDIEGGHVGGPAPWAQVKLVDVEELSYSASKNAGEVCFRGAALMSGYFKDDELTAKVIDDEGWLHTGDIGEWLSDGSLRIIDRKSNFLKLSQGDFVSPEEVEKIYSQHPAIKQVLEIVYEI
ncbi:unnamed protein product [Anisakis simplex]|uniref:long-chain-fatty-acid--CoA ligase n=1 Tax=Anisakis simplex TaxID=6269 RepID=A0A0M3J319_ANISI|nr:unnamed protein product [Anisakis simplex]